MKLARNVSCNKPSTKDLDYAPARLHLAQLYLRQGRLDWAATIWRSLRGRLARNTEASLMAQRLLARLLWHPLAAEVLDPCQEW